MIPAKKLIPETEKQVQHIQETSTEDRRVYSIVKLLIMILLTYAIIFM